MEGEKKKPPPNQNNQKTTALKCLRLLKHLIFCQAMQLHECDLIVHQQIPEFPYFETMFWKPI